MCVLHVHYRKAFNLTTAVYLGAQSNTDSIQVKIGQNLQGRQVSFLTIIAQQTTKVFPQMIDNSSLKRL